MDLNKVLYVSADLLVYPDKVCHLALKKPNADLLKRALKHCGFELDGEPFMENGCWCCNVKEARNEHN